MGAKKGRIAAIVKRANDTGLSVRSVSVEIAHTFTVGVPQPTPDTPPQSVVTAILVRVSLVMSNGGGATLLGLVTDMATWADAVDDLTVRAFELVGVVEAP